ncbi:MAG: RnfABCDGE type electron transport complex subunit D [Candidatus Paceibacterota bacterium]|jgi:ferredoxin-NADP reductase
MLSFVDHFLNKITMYRLVLYYLIALLIIAASFGIFGWLPVDPIDLAFSTVLIFATCWITNIVFAKGFDAPTNVESVYITALILVLIISPVAYTDYLGVSFIVFASAWAMASKFIVAVHKKHLFNPAAFGVAFSSLALNQGATWWVGGNLPLLPLVLLGGLLIVRKIRRFDLVASFSIVALVTIVATSPNSSSLTPIVQTFLHSPFFFLAFVMLTEPLTMPSTRLGRLAFGAIIGFLFAPNIHIGSFYFTPEIALLVGNLFAYFVSPEGRFTLTLIGKNKIASGMYDFVFKPDWLFNFYPGQYLEWTIPHRSSDNRGNRRYFTIASSPTEEEVRLGVKFYEPKSSFKQALDGLQIGDTVSVSQLTGDFVLPKDPAQKLVFIAGGIGITPFRSMVRYLVDTNDTRSIVLLYSNKFSSEIAYKETFDEAAQKIGMKTVYVLTGEPHPVPGTYAGRIHEGLIANEIPDYKERTFYISGPPAMVSATARGLHTMGVSRSRIKTDYFPGFA